MRIAFLTAAALAALAVTPDTADAQYRGRGWGGYRGGYYSNYRPYIGGYYSQPYYSGYYSQPYYYTTVRPGVTFGVTVGGGNYYYYHGGYTYYPGGYSYWW